MKTRLEEFMSGDAIVLCSLITFLPAGLVPIMSANSQLSAALLPTTLSSAGIAFMLISSILLQHLNRVLFLAALKMFGSKVK